jgi:hypothetical protein
LKLVIFGFLLGWIVQIVVVWLLIYLSIHLFRLARWAYWEANDRWYYYQYVGHF